MSDLEFEMTFDFFVEQIQDRCKGIKNFTSTQNTDKHAHLYFQHMGDEAMQCIISWFKADQSFIYIIYSTIEKDLDSNLIDLDRGYSDDLDELIVQFNESPENHAEAKEFGLSDSWTGPERTRPLI